MTSPRRGFSLIEVLIGLLTLGLLAAIVSFTMGSLQNTSRERVISNAAKLFDEAYRSRLAYDLSVGATSSTDLNARIALAAAQAGTAVDVTTAPTEATFASEGSAVCLTYATDPDVAGVIVSGAC